MSAAASILPPAQRSDDWLEANQRRLVAGVAAVRSHLERHLARTRGQDEPAVAAVEAHPATNGLPPPALDVLCATFRLSPFERDLLLLCAAMDLDGTIGALCAAAQGDAQRAYPTFGLALAALAGPHWSALAPHAPLRRWRLIDVGAGSTLTASPLRIDERVLHYLAGVRYLDAHLADLVEPVTAAEPLVPSQREVAERVAAAWSRAADGPPPVVQLAGIAADAKRPVAATACAALGLDLHLLDAGMLPTTPGDLGALLRLWDREAVLSGSALLLDCDGPDLDLADVARARAIGWLIEHSTNPLLVACRDRRPTRHRATLAFEVRPPRADEQRAAWKAALGEAGLQLNGQVDALVGQFTLGTTAIRAAATEALGLGGDAGTAELGGLLWEASRTQARARLDDLATRIEPVAGWDDLVLPEQQRETLRAIAAQVRQRSAVYERWGFATKGARGLGISALFAGASGTGKTMAAEVLAQALRLDLYRIDLSGVVSKYIGETEKNLRRVFDAAEEGGAILLFDEADALFGKRSEVKDSHDRYANIEVGYLLQRMETYRGLAILTTNLKAALDVAFLRRLRFVVQFPFPDAAGRAEIWRRIFPSATPTAGLDVERLAQLNVAGGNIRTIAINAAFLAAEAGEPVRMAHLLAAARSEYAKLEKPLTGAEITGWS